MQIETEKIFIDAWYSWIFNVIITIDDNIVVNHTERWFGLDSETMLDEVITNAKLLIE